MRPKIVLLAFAAGICLLILIGVVRNRPTSTDATTNQPASVVTDANSPGGTPTPDGIVMNSPTGIVASTVEQDLEKQRSVDEDAIEDALTKPPGDEGALFAVATRLENPDEEIRSAARDAAMHLGNTNILPALISVMQRSTDSREKAALLEVIEYLELPDTIEPDQIDAASATNRTAKTARERLKRSKAAVRAPVAAPGKTSN